MMGIPSVESLRTEAIELKYPLKPLAMARRSLMMLPSTRKYGFGFGLSFPLISLITFQVSAIALDFLKLSEVMKFFGFGNYTFEFSAEIFKFQI